MPPQYQVDPSKSKGRTLPKAIHTHLFAAAYLVRPARAPFPAAPAPCLRRTKRANPPHSTRKPHARRAALSQKPEQAHRLADREGCPALPEEVAAAAAPLMAPWWKEATVK